MHKELLADLEKQARVPFPRQLRPFKRLEGALLELEGRQFVDFTSWDVFGLSRMPKLKLEAQRAIENFGTTHAAARSSSGTSKSHLVFESKLAKFFCLPGCITVSSRNQAIVSIANVILAERDVVLYGDTSQSPIGDACHLMNATSHPCPLLNSSKIAQELEKLRDFRRRFVYVESLCPITGLVYDLKQIAKTCLSHGAYLIVDESASLGIVGLRGAGACEIPDVASAIFCVIGDLGLAINSMGGFVCGPTALIAAIHQRSHSLGSDPAIPAHFLELSDSALDLVETSMIWREKLVSLASRVRQRFPASYLIGPADSTSPVLALSFRKAADAYALASTLFSRGLLTDVFYPGIVPGDSAVIRVILSLSHTERQVDLLTQTICEALPGPVLK